MVTTTLKVRGMRCAGCVSHVEKSLQATPGVQSAAVNLATEQATVTHDARKASSAQLIAAVRAAGYEAEAENEDGAASLPRETGPPAWWPLARLLGGAALAAPVVVGGMFFHHSLWSVWGQFALATPVQIILGWPFYRGAIKAAAHGRADMDTLVALGTSVAYGASVVTLLAGETAVYFDTAVVILVLIGLGKMLESRARAGAAAAIRGLMNLQPPTATVFRAGREMDLPVAQVVPGDIVLVRPGQRVPVDGQATEGDSTIDQSMVTGESIPVEITAGSAVIGGTINHTGAFRFRATRTGKDTLLAHIVELVKNAQASKADVQRLADAVAGVFVPAVLVLALTTLLGWGLLAHNWGFGMQTLVAVLIVACPCALGLATPTAIMVGTGLGAQRGILIKDAAALERAGKLTHVILDKTGTLTLGRPAVTDVLPLPAGLTAAQLLALAAAVEQNSEHPLGRAIVAAARAQGLTLEPVTEFQSITAGGVRGRVGGKDVLVGKPDTLAAAGIVSLPQAAALTTDLHVAGKTAVAVAVAGQAVGVIALADQIKPGAAQAVAELHRLGLKVLLLTGDHQAPARAVARQLGIDEVLAEVLPPDKQAQVVLLQRQGAVVAMVGDGINDAPALAAADIGIAMGGEAKFSPVAGAKLRAADAARSSVPPASSGADIAMEAGHVVLVGGDLAALPRAIRLSRATMRRIYAGLFWAFIYNMVLIPIAVAGWLHPMLAAAAMAFSSVSVVVNALWLKWSWRE